MRKAGIAFLVWLVVAFLVSSSLMWAQSYSVIDLKALPDYGSTLPGGLNESGQVVGTSQNSTGAVEAFLWTPGKGLKSLGAGGASAINSQGDVVGVAYPQDHAFLWKHDGTTQDLGALGGNWKSSFADGINSDDWIVGNSQGNTALGPAFLWTPNAGMQDIGTGTGTDPFAIAIGINDSDEVVGYKSNNNGSYYDAFSWTQGVGMKDLGEGAANAINASGVIAGVLYPSARAVLWNPDGSMTKLGTLGGTTSLAQALNDHGVVVGYADTTTAAHAFVWTAKGGMQDLNAMIPASFQSKWTLYSGMAVNNAGQIAVWVFQAGGGTVDHALLLSPLMKVTETSSVNPSVVGQAVTFTATITSIVGAPPNGETVSFKNAQNVVLGSGTISGGVAQFTTSSLTEGTHYITAVYVGDVNYASAKSAAITQVVNK